ncbi:MAG: c-type cytochrome [Phycisphaerales bacterium]|nr:c-type cytochrome [Phycisphaerales bacterium]
MNTESIRTSAVTSPRSAERLALGLAAGVTIAAAGLAVIATLFMSAAQRSATPRPQVTLAAAPILAPPGPRLDSAALSRGRDHFAATCALCHGEDGLGRPGLGKNLATSAFIAKCSDGYISAFLEKGRDANDPLNTTKVPMPPKGGNPDLTRDDLADIVTYLRGLQDPRRVEAGVSLLAHLEVPEEPEPGPAARVTAVSTAAGDSAAGGDSEDDDWYDAETIALGAKMYKASCVSCHGPDARGLKNLGKDLVTSRFIADADDDAMLAFLKKGRPASDPANTTKVDMPPKGGNPALNDEKMEAIIAYIRDLQRKATTTKS